MSDEFDAPSVEPDASLDVWRKSRSGAWASQGFHYQHLVSALILVRQWAGLAPPGYLVPEGFEDCVLEFSSHRTWVQIKSRNDGTFSDSEVLGILAAIKNKTARLRNGPEIRPAVVIQRPRAKTLEAEIDRLFDDGACRVFVCQTPGDEIVRLLLTKLRIAAVIAEGLANDLYRLVADAAAENASLPFDKRRRISVTEVDRHLFEHLEAEDHSAIDEALISGAIEPVDFTTAIDEPDFYRGVKVKVGHVVANLVLDRPNDVNGVLDALRQRRHVLISGPSGAGKSALVWLAVTAVASRLRWFQITGLATVAHTEAIIRFVRARNPTEMSPIGLVFDDLGSENSTLWDLLVRELRGFPSLYFLGSVRQEDVSLIANQSDTVFIPVVLNEGLAESVWGKLSSGNHTSWTHWREPFEQSEGLMLEYVHLLTEGRRLAAVIGEQILYRERQNRHDELRTIRSASVICARGGEVVAHRLFEILNLRPDVASRALRRLIDEHLVRESRPGVLGGLHMLRSDALVKASHDETIFLASDTLWKSLPATTNETLPTVVQSVLAVSGEDNEPRSLQKLAEILSESQDIDQWISILTGLGLATIERLVALFMTLLEQHKVKRAHWSLASMFADPELEVPDLPKSEQFQNLQRAVLAFRTLPKHDLRAACLTLLPEGSSVPRCDGLLQANRLLSCLVPICGGEPVRIQFEWDFHAVRDPSVRRVASLLSTAYLIDPSLATDLVGSFGGEQTLFDLFRSQTPWTTPPIIEPAGVHGRTVRSNWHQVTEQHQPDPHEAVCEICETLIALSPGSDGAASDAVDPLGQTIAVGDFKPWSKDMPRRNIPAKTRVAWNVAFRQIFMARAAAENLTDYARQMAVLVRDTEKTFSAFTEKWIKAKRISHPDPLVSKIKRIFDAVNVLAYAAPENPSFEMTEPVQAGTADKLGALLNGVLGNLIRRLSKFETAKATATFAGSLAGQADEHRESAIWRTISSPPLTDLGKLSKRLEDVSWILHEIAYDREPEVVQSIVRTARKARLGNATRTAARISIRRAEVRFETRLRELEAALRDCNRTAHCVSRPIRECNSPYWPARQVAVLVEISDILMQWVPHAEEILSVGTKHLANDWPFIAIPVLNNQLLASLALRPSSGTPTMPDPDSGREWSQYIDKPMFVSTVGERFDEGVAACLEVSATIACRGIQDLHPEEDEVLSKALDSFETRREILANEAELTGTEHSAIALDFLDRSWNQVAAEFEAAKSGRPIDNPLCMTAYSALGREESKYASDLTAVRLLILEAECANSGGACTP